MRGGHNKRDLRGMTFGRLTVEAEAEKVSGRIRWRCPMRIVRAAAALSEAKT